MLRYHLNISST